VIPPPGDDSLFTGVLAERLQLGMDNHGRLLRQVLNRLARSGLLVHTKTGRRSYWQKSPLLQTLLTTLPAADTGAIATTDVADRLGLTDTTAATALDSLAWCGIAERVALTDRPAVRYWRLPCTDHRDRQPRNQAVLDPVTVVTLIGSKQPRSRGRALADATIDALTTAGIIRPGRRHVLELGQLGADAFTTAPHGTPASARLLETVHAADLLIATTPTYLGTFSGLMKACLDDLGPTALCGTVAVVGAVQTTTGRHSPAAAALTSVLAEMGAHLPAPPLVVQGPQNPKQVAAGWAALHGPAITPALAARAAAATARPAAAGPTPTDRSAAHPHLTRADTSRDHTSPPLHRSAPEGEPV
jgi:FMN reductase